MKVLIISFWFPPSNAMGAVRAGKLASYLHAQGHDVKVIAGDGATDKTLPLEIPQGNAIYAKHWDIDSAVAAVMRRIRPGTGGGTRSKGRAAAAGATRRSALRSVLQQHYYALVRIPDNKVGWLPSSLSGGRKLIRQWRPDLIYASAPPYSGLLVAKKLAKEFDVPWVAELRDLWADNPYYGFPPWRNRLDRRLERAVMRHAAAIVTVSPPWAEALQRVYSKPVVSILNGYADEDLPTDVAVRQHADEVSVVYTGNLYVGFRDPSPLFAAIAQLGERRRHVRVDFYGPTPEDVEALAARCGVRDRVFVLPRVAYRESLALQLRADVLLLLQRNDRSDEGNVPAKFFEYIGARRPILLLGYEAGTVAKMILERSAGFVANSPRDICDRLALWVDQQRNGGIPDLPWRAKAGLSRSDQYRKLESFLLDRVIGRQ